MPPRRVYLDHAATSWPKPDEVYAAVDHYQRTLGAPAGRGMYAEAIEVARLIQNCRNAVARLFGAKSAEIIFANSGTDALNLALHGLLREGDHVVTSQAEHNSVLRPLQSLIESRQITVTQVPCDSSGRIDPDDVRQAIQPQTRLVALTHASNVTGAIQPLVEIGNIVRDCEALFLVDAAQTAGHMPVSVASLQCDLLATPGHKGMLGPLGTGILYIRSGVEQQLASLRQGGTGSHSELDQQPEFLPDKYEAGNLNVPGIVGLGAALGWIERLGVNRIQEHELRLTTRLRDGLRQISGVQLVSDGIASESSKPSLSVVSFNLEDYDPQEVATLLDSAFGVQVRAGLHCAAAIHQALGTAVRGGTVRISSGALTTMEDIETALKAIEAIATDAPA